MERFVKYLVVCFLLVLGLALLAIFMAEVSIGFWSWVVFVLCGTVFITIGSYLGGLFRDFVAPDAYVTRGVTDSFKKRIFWMMGPQAIGAFIGYIGTGGFLMNILGMTQFYFIFY